MSFFTVISGDEEFLVDREVRAIAEGSEVQVVEAVGLTIPGLDALLSPSLFASPKVLHVRKAQSLTKPVLDGLGRVLSLLDADTKLVLSVSTKSTAALKTAKDLGGKVIKTQAVKNGRDQATFLRTEVRTHKRRVTEGAVQVILGATRGDLRSMSSLVRQMAVDAEEDLWDEEVVNRFTTGSGETSGFAVADATYEGRAGQAIGLLHAALRSGTDPVLVSNALITTARDLSKVVVARSTSPADVAGALKMADWRARKVVSLARDWDATAVARALALAVATDAAVKGGRSDTTQALHEAVIAITLAKRRA